jgi:flagellar biosynthesis anti-sigma factor FlgM
MNSIDPYSAQSVPRTHMPSADAAQNSGVSAKAGRTHQHHRQVTQPADSVSLSDSAKSLAAARSEVQSVPDVREQRITGIKQQISDGTYSVSSKVLARKMMSPPPTQE